MKVSIAFLLVALGCCFGSSSSFNIAGMENMPPEDSLYFSRYMQHLMEKYEDALQSESENRNFKMKCTMNGILSLVREVSEKLGCSMEDVLHKMGLSDLSIQDMEEIIQGGGSINDLDPEQCEDLIISLLRGLLELLFGLLGPLLDPLSGILEGAIGPNRQLGALTGSLLGGEGGLLEGILRGDIGPLRGLHGGDGGGLLGGLPGRESGGLLGGLLGGEGEGILVGLLGGGEDRVLEDVLVKGGVVGGVTDDVSGGKGGSISGGLIDGNVGGNGGHNGEKHRGTPGEPMGQFTSEIIDEESGILETSSIEDRFVRGLPGNVIVENIGGHSGDHLGGEGGPLVGDLGGKDDNFLGGVTTSRVTGGIIEGEDGTLVGRVIGEPNDNVIGVFRDTVTEELTGGLTGRLTNRIPEEQDGSLEGVTGGGVVVGSTDNEIGGINGASVGGFSDGKSDELLGGAFEAENRSISRVFSSSITDGIPGEKVGPLGGVNDGRGVVRELGDDVTGGLTGRILGKGGRHVGTTGGGDIVEELPANAIGGNGGNSVGEYTSSQLGGEVGLLEDVLGGKVKDTVSGFTSSITGELIGGEDETIMNVTGGGGDEVVSDVSDNAIGKHSDDLTGRVFEEEDELLDTVISGGGIIRALKGNVTEEKRGGSIGGLTSEIHGGEGEPLEGALGGTYGSIVGEVGSRLTGGTLGSEEGAISNVIESGEVVGDISDSSIGGFIDDNTGELTGRIIGNEEGRIGIATEKGRVTEGLNDRIAEEKFGSSVGGQGNGFLGEGILLKGAPVGKYGDLVEGGTSRLTGKIIGEEDGDLSNVAGGGGVVAELSDNLIGTLTGGPTGGLTGRIHGEVDGLLGSVTGEGGVIGVLAGNVTGEEGRDAVGERTGGRLEGRDGNLFSSFTGRLPFGGEDDLFGGIIGID